MKIQPQVLLCDSFGTTYEISKIFNQGIRRVYVRLHQLEKIAETVKNCTNCKLCETRTNAVPGKGNFGADVIFVGEAPGRNEDINGEPFVGAAGKKLDAILADTGIDRKDVYITNIVKCRPPSNLSLIHI